MLNFACLVDSDASERYDSGGRLRRMVHTERRKEAICHDSLAERFLAHWVDKREEYALAHESHHF